LPWGRYRWRHDKVLEAIASVLEPAIKTHKPTKQNKLTFINFVKSGHEKKKSNPISGILGSAADWEIRVDLRKRLQFPGEITQTRLRPDIVIWSRKSRQVIMVELTVPWEDRIESANERKRTKYEELKTACEGAGWRTWCMPAETGCRSFIAKSVWKVCKMLGMGSNTRKRLCRVCQETAERTSNWVWLKRNDKQWLPT
jgi:hypothetical protein